MLIGHLAAAICHPLGYYLFRKIEEKDIGNIRFQQDGFKYHTAETTLDNMQPQS